MARGALIGGIVVAVLVLALWVLQRRLIYLPTGDPGPPPPGWTGASVSTSDGIDLGLWHRAPVDAVPVVVVFNGNAGNRGDRIALGSALAREGFGVVLFDYRGYGGNPGAPSEDGLGLDAAAVAAFARSTYPGNRLLFFGESLGAAVAVGAASTSPPDGVVLRSPFTNLADAASANYFGVPLGWFLWDDYPTIDRMPTLEAPVTVVAGTNDGIVPIEQSRRVFDAAAEPVDWVAIEGAGHNDPVLSSGPDVIDAVVRLADALDS